MHSKKLFSVTMRMESIRNIKYKRFGENKPTSYKVPTTIMVPIVFELISMFTFELVC